MIVAIRASKVVCQLVDEVLDTLVHLLICLPQSRHSFFMLILCLENALIVVKLLRCKYVVFDEFKLLSIVRPSFKLLIL